MHFKKTLLWKVFPIMPGTSKYPFWAESHCVMVSLKGGPLRGKASQLVEVQLPWGPPLNLENPRPLIGQKKPRLSRKPLQHAISPQPGAWAKKPPARDGPDRVNNHIQYTHNGAPEIYANATVNMLYIKCRNLPPPSNIIYISIWNCLYPSLPTLPLSFSSPSPLPASALQSWGGWQSGQQLQWPGELPWSGESCCVFCIGFPPPPEASPRLLVSCGAVMN